MTPAEPASISFDQIWSKAILSVSRTVLDESDPEFAQQCGLRASAPLVWKPALYDEYLRLRDELKNICYGSSDGRSPEYLLDGRKIAAVLCAALISKKGFWFDPEQARAFTEAKKEALKDDPVRFNRWAAQNVYINYKLAFSASLQLVYLTLMRDLLVKAGLEEPGTSKTPGPLTPGEMEEREHARQLATALNKIGRLASYPQPSKGDAFEVNIIVGLARTDMSAKALDMFLFAMQLYQIEEHTVDLLEKALGQ